MQAFYPLKRVLSLRRYNLKDSESGVAAVDRGLTILAAFRPGDRAVPLTELAARTGLYKSTIMRLCESLEKFHYVRRLPDGSYQLAAGAAKLGATYLKQFATADYVPQVLERIVSEVNETASYYVRDDDRRVCIHRVHSSRAIRDQISEGDALPLHVGAAGHVLIAFSCTLSKKPRGVKEQFFSASFGERDPETAAIAVPVFGLENELHGALSLSGPRYRIETLELAKVVPILWKYAAQVTKLFGGEPTVYPSSIPSGPAARNSGNRGKTATDR